MLRIGIVSYLMLVLAAGPWYCCCTLSRLHDLLTLTVAEEASDTLPIHCGCCCPKEESPSPSNAEPDSSPSPPPERPHCPCSDRHKLQPVVGAKDGSAGRELSTRNPLTDFQPLATCLALIAAPALDLIGEKPRESLAFPFLTAQDILRHLQSYCC